MKKGLSIWEVLSKPKAAATERVWKATSRLHSGRLNMSFCDGHVEGMRIADVFDVHGDDVLKKWSNDNLPHHELGFP